LILLQVRSVDASPEWKPPHTFNFLDDPHLPYSAKAKIICDVAASLGQKTEQSFFRMQAQVQMEFAFWALAAAGYEVTLEHAYDMFATQVMLDEVVERLKEKDTLEPVSL